MIAIVIAFENFRDEEYFVPKQIFEQSGFEVVTVSNKAGIARGADGGEVEVSLLSELKDYDALVFVGGSGCLANLDNSVSYQKIQEAVAEGKLLAAICISPVVLANAGVLSGKKATVWTSSMDKGPANILKEKGALYEKKDVVVDGGIITAVGPQAAESFGREIVKYLKNIS